ncbi:hypothetical protein [uncultured Hyphomonas sp.]|uniref:hypothetical protein n=1 Tax=uncultured Hyphomonas sp. TaxID=225298 RepID=UPI002AAC4589|nr:hypothetical protein [uncultured Hyphomonas sp.]
MDPTTIAWIIVIVGGSVVAKFLGLIFKNRDPGVVTGPIAGVVGAILAWQGAMAAGLITPINLAAAGICAVAGGAIVYLMAAFAKGRPA